MSSIFVPYCFWNSQSESSILKCHQCVDLSVGTENGLYLTIKAMIVYELKNIQNMFKVFGTSFANKIKRSISTTLKMSTDCGPIAKAITESITETLQPVHLEVINESYMHNVPKGSETHFKVLVVSEQFQDLTLLKRHRLINEVVKSKLDGNFVHALSIEAKTPAQWNEAYKVEPSPNCRGGFGK